MHGIAIVSGHFPWTFPLPDISTGHSPSRHFLQTFLYSGGCPGNCLIHVGQFRTPPPSTSWLVCPVPIGRLLMLVMAFVNLTSIYLKNVFHQPWRADRVTVWFSVVVRKYAPGFRYLAKNSFIKFYPIKNYFASSVKRNSFRQSSFNLVRHSFINPVSIWNWYCKKMAASL